MENFHLPENFIDPGLPKGYMSPSQFSMYMRCSMQYYFRYVLDRKDPPGIAQLQGRVIHRGAEFALLKKMAKEKVIEKEAIEHASAFFDEKTAEIEDWGDQDKGTTKNLTLSYLGVYLVQAVPVITPLAVEKQFTAKFGVVPMVGVIDLIDQIPMKDELHPDLPPVDAQVVLDLKFTSRSWDEQRLRFEPQLTYYAHITGTPYVGIDMLLEKKHGNAEYRRKPSIRTPKDVSLLIEDTEMAADNIKKGRVPRCLPTNWNCTPKFCGYYKVCRGF